MVLPLVAGDPLLEERPQAKQHRNRYPAVYELSLEATRRPALQQTFDAMKSSAVDFTHEQHQALGLTTSRG
ncbi:hypothetical protein AB0G73_35870 [Streptomyces sp. NPDC020719]|uniref:hypothetical protein n=1 Tax=Streptomyces sp. NPDC020719 TaxID=3154896 RepID=UPI0033D092B0